MSKRSKSTLASLTDFTRSKIIATVGPATNSYEKIHDLVESGVDGFRLNFSHGSYEERIEQIGWIRKAAKEFNVNVAIIQDLQGPKIRLGDFEGVKNVVKGQELKLDFNGKRGLDDTLPTQYDLSKKVKRGDQVYLYDGKVRGVVTNIKDSVVTLRIENDGILMKRKGINLPDTDLAGEIITKKDRQDIVFGSEQDIDWVALSFVQTAEDVKGLKRLLKNLGSSAKVITKVETKAAIENIESIVKESDGIMIARGDLAIETLPESVPVLQRRIIGLCLKHEKISIVATQMMVSMMEQPEPTRAEVSDVATAVIVGADGVMLSDETANGRYPVEAVKMMERIIRYTQENSNVRAQFTDHHEYSITEAIAATIIDLSKKVGATVIVAETETGNTAYSISAWRPSLPLVVVTPHPRVAQQLALLYGAQSFVRPVDELAATKLTDWLRKEKVLSKGEKIVTASGKYPGFTGGTDTIKVRVLD
jgi:pyruvate kinase